MAADREPSEGCAQLQCRCRGHELLGREAGARPEGGGLDPARQREPAGLPRQRRCAHRQRGGRGRLSQAPRRRCRGACADRAQRCGPQLSRLRAGRHRHRTGAGQVQRPDRGRRWRQPVRGRCRSHPGQSGRPAAGLEQAGRPRDARDLHADREAAVAPHRGSAARRLGRRACAARSRSTRPARSSTANFPVFALSDGDKATVKAERASDGTLQGHGARRRL